MYCRLCSLLVDDQLLALLRQVDSVDVAGGQVGVGREVVLVRGRVLQLAGLVPLDDLRQGAELQVEVQLQQLGDPETGTGDVLEDVQRRGQGHGLHRHTAVREHESVGGQLSGHAGRALATDAVEREFDLAAGGLGPLLNLGAKLPGVVLLLCDDVGGAVLGAQLAGKLLEVWSVSHHRDRVDAEKRADLGRVATHGRVTAILDEPVLAWLQLDVVGQHQVRCQGIDGDRGTLVNGERFATAGLTIGRIGDLDHLLVQTQSMGSPCAEVDLSWNTPVARLELADAGPDLDNFK